MRRRWAPPPCWKQRASWWRTRRTFPPPAAIRGGHGGVRAALQEGEARRPSEGRGGARSPPRAKCREPNRSNGLSHCGGRSEEPPCPEREEGDCVDVTDASTCGFSFVLDSKLRFKGTRIVELAAKYRTVSVADGHVLPVLEMGGGSLREVLLNARSYFKEGYRVSQDMKETTRRFNKGATTGKKRGKQKTRQNCLPDLPGERRGGAQ